jgi:hypothetical protein
MTDHKPPQEIDTEESILVSIILDQEHRQKAFESLSTEDFYSTANSIIFKKCKELQSNGGHIETADIYSALSEDEKKFVKAEFLYRLTDAVPLAVNIEDYIKRVKDAAKYRRAIELCNAIAKNACKSDSEAIEKLTRQLVIETREPEADFPVQKDTDISFPYHVMAGAAGFFANVYGEVMEAPQSFLFMSYLTCLGSILSPLLSLPSVLDTEPRLYTLLVGRSNVERKSTTIKAAIKLFRDCTYGFKYHHGVGSDMGLAKLLNELDRFDEGSIGTLLLFDEFKTFVNKCKIQAQVLLQCVNTLFENNEFENATKNKHVLIDDAHLSILGATTLQTYERIYDREFIDIGFPNRVFIVPDMAQRRFPIPQQISAEDQLSLKEQLKQITLHVGRNLELSISDEANTLYNEWYFKLPDSIYADRMETYSLRLAMLLAVNDLKPNIDLETMQKATALCDWQIEVRREHDPIDAEDRTTEMEERIRRVLQKGPQSESQIKQTINPWKGGNKPISLWVFNNAFKNLRTANEIECNKKVWTLVEDKQNY